MPGRGPGQHSALEGGTVLRARVGPGGGVSFSAARRARPTHRARGERVQACAPSHWSGRLLAALRPAEQVPHTQSRGSHGPRTGVAQRSPRRCTRMRTHVSGAQSGTAPVCTSQSPAPVGTLWRLAKAAATAGQLSASQEGSRASPGGPRADEGGGGGVRARGLRGARSVWREQGERERPGTCLACRSPTLHLTLATQRDPSGVEWL